MNTQDQTVWERENLHHIYTLANAIGEAAEILLGNSRSLDSILLLVFFLLSLMYFPESHSKLSFQFSWMKNLGSYIFHLFWFRSFFFTCLNAKFLNRVVTKTSFLKLSKLSLQIFEPLEFLYKRTYIFMFLSAKLRKEWHHWLS